MFQLKLGFKTSKLKLIWPHLSKRRKTQFLLLLIIMIFTSLLEVISIGLVIPFLGIMTAPEQIFQNKFMQPFIEWMGLVDPSELTLPLTIIFISAILISGFARLILLYLMVRVSFATGADISIQVYRNTLYQDYLTHTKSNSSEIINSVITKTNLMVNGVLSPVLTLISSVIFIVVIMTALLVINVKVALLVTIGFGLLYWIIIKYTRQQVNENSQCIASQSTLMIKALQEGLGGIRDVLIDGSQEFYCKIYRNADLPMRLATGNNHIIGASPRFIIEMVGMSLIAILGYLATQQEGGLITAIPVLGTFALGAQRLLPMLQQSYAAYTKFKSSSASFEDVLILLGRSIPRYANQSKVRPLVFSEKIELKNLSFRYSKNTPLILKNINIKIDKGSRVGFVGETGSGKSTLMDIIMGLLHQTEGHLIIDKQSINNKNRRAWQMHIAHVPQNIYLTDSTIEQNIAFGVPQSNIDKQKVKEAAKQARISNLIEGWEYGYQTIVGERGTKLSGGQCQRIGIARALYKDADVLILDEATSALDNQTEYSVMKAIKGLRKDLTIFIVAHRLTTLKECDRIIRLDKNTIIDSENYQNIGT